MLKMADLHDLQTRAGEVEKAVGESNDQQGDLLDGIQDGLSAVRDRLIHMKIENDRLFDENARLKQVIVELLESLENKSKDPLHDKLRDLDSQLSVLLEMSGADSAAVLGNSETGSLGASKSDGVDDDADEPAGALSLEANGTSPNELGSLEALAHKARTILPKKRMRFDAEVDYAMRILRRLKGRNQPFSIEEVRDLISGKFGLGLTSQHDAQIAASLSKQDDLKPDATDGKSWKFIRA